MREYATEHDWLTIVHLPSCAPDLNPVEGVWSLLRRGPPANVAFTDDENLERALRRGLRHMRLRPNLIDGCLWPARRYGEGGRCGERSTSRVISLGAKTRNGGPQKPVPRLV